MTDVFLAAPLTQAVWADAMGRRLATLGHAVTSRWHRTSQVLDPDDLRARAAILRHNVYDLDRAEACIVLASRGPARAMYGDAVYALLANKAVIWVHGAQGEGRCLWDSHPSVVRMVDQGDDEALSASIAEKLRRPTQAELSPDGPDSALGTGRKRVRGQ
jgi:hypothetical protein